MGSEKEVQAQLARFRRGFSKAKLVEQLRPGTEVLLLSPKEEANLLHLYEKEAPRRRPTVFIPASGMASRMFKALYPALSTGKVDIEEVRVFFSNLERLPFYALLRNSMAATGESLESCLQTKAYAKIVDYLLTERGLNYEETPKLALPFHTYGEEIRPCWLEHVYEARHYATDKKGNVRLHATLPSHTTEAFLSDVNQVLSTLGRTLQMCFLFTYSYQDPRTHSLAIYSESRQPVRTPKGEYLWRPSGHGSLLQNLQEVDAELIFIKNVDNIQTQRHHLHNAYYKKLLGGRALELRTQLDQLQTALRAGHPDAVPTSYSFLEQTFLIREHPVDRSSDLDLQRSYLLKKLNRPLRVCGLVRSRDGAGGAPFLCRSADGGLAPQIVEPPQVNKSDPRQASLFTEAVYMNPVDIACILNDAAGERFDLKQFRDTESGFITEKSYQGRSILVQELPGLWNGSMSEWNTSFIEVPADTFSPVKQLSDLLSAAHQSTLV